MAEFSANDREMIRRAAIILFNELLEPGTIPGGPPELSNLDQVRGFVDWMGMQILIHENVDNLRAALADAGAALAAAHAAASSVLVEAPSEQQIAEFKEKLEDLNSDIQLDQQFHAALQLANGLVSAIENHMNA